MRLKALRNMFIFSSTALLFLSVFELNGISLDEKCQRDTAVDDAVVKTINDVNSLISSGKYSESETLARKLLEETELNFGIESLEYAKVLDVMVAALCQTGKANEPESRSYGEKAIEIKGKLLGEDHIELALSHSNMATLYYQVGEYGNAKSAQERTLAIQQKSLGSRHSEVANSMSSLGEILRVQGDYSAALGYHQKALMIHRETLDPGNPQIAESLMNKAFLHYSMGDYSDALPLLHEALTINEKAFGPEHPMVAHAVNSLGAILYLMGEYEQAQSLYEKALAMDEKLLGDDHPDIMSRLSNLALLLHQKGKYNEAVQLYERALSIAEKGSGPDHPMIVPALNNYAQLLMTMGYYEKAKLLYERAMKISIKAYGSEHQRTAQLINDIAGILERTGDTAGALKYYERALDIYLKVLDPDHFFTAISLNNIGRLHLKQGNFKEARDFLERALLNHEKAIGPEHPLTTKPLTNLAHLELKTGDYKESLLLFERAITIQETSLGKDHPQVAKSLLYHSQALRKSGAIDQALASILRAEEIGREHFRLTIRYLPEKDALRYAKIRTCGLDMSLSLAIDNFNKAPSEISGIWDTLIHSRALVLEEMATRNLALWETDRPEISLLIQDYVSAQQRMANLSVRGTKGLSPETYRKLLDKARQEKEQTEEMLAKESAIFRLEVEKRDIDLKEIAASLPRKSVLVAYARYNHFQESRKDPESQEGLLQKKISEDSNVVPSYLAFVLRQGHADPTVVQLGTASDMEELVSNWRRELIQEETDRWRDPKVAENDYRKTAAALRKMAWDPLAIQPSDVEQIFIVPDGIFHLVNFAALPWGKDRYLVEAGPSFHYLSAERDIAAVSVATERGKDLFALGGPDFEVADHSGALSVSNNVLEADKPEKIAALQSFRGERSGCGDFNSLRFSALSSSLDEVGIISNLWKMKLKSKGDRKPKESDAAFKRSKDAFVLTGPLASEAAFKRQASGKRVLHLATHGFFLGSDCPSTLDVTDSQLFFAELEKTRSSSFVGENPLLLSGLALAGANHREKAGPDDEDGILTAEEIAAMDLNGVEWAVLSACNTGLGEIKAGEGVFGLRRAFQIAGARTVIMSLWSVEDKAALEWMKDLYKARFVNEMSTAESVHHATLKSFRRAKKKYRSTHPYYWAGFVAAGDWR
ncbi:tetratricopeptide repeat protein [Acidobacteriota bacterium]